MDVETLMVHPDALPPETLISGWRVLGKSGRGGFGVVYRVEDAVRPGQVYALKMALRLGDPRAERETMLLLTKANHPNIVRIHGHGRWPHPEEGYHYIVMDYVEGSTFIEWVESTNPTFHQLAAVVDKLALALGFLNDNDAWHRDVKPENILVRSRDGEPFLLDLSVGDYEGADTLTDQPLPPGTPYCRSPEALRFNRQNWGRRGAHYEYKATDELYALGVTAYRALTGHWPFPLELPRELLEDAILWRVPPSPDAVNRRVPPALASLVMRLLDKDPKARPESGRELHEALVAVSAFGEAAAWEATCFEWEEVPDVQHRRIRRPEPPRLLPPPQPPEPPRAVPFAPSAVSLPLDFPKTQAAPSGEPELARAAPSRSATPMRERRAFGWGHAWRQGTLLGGLALLLGVGLILAVVGSYPTSQVGPVPHARPTHEVADWAESPDASRAAAPPRADATPAVVADPAAHLKEPTSVKTKQDTSKKPAARRRSDNLKKAAVAATCLELSAGCTSAQVKPFEEEPCPSEALAVMERLGFTENTSGLLVLDIHQPDTASGELGRYQDGPITSVLKWDEKRILPPGSLLIGTLWTYGGRKPRAGVDMTYGRYTEVRTPQGERYPVCFLLGNRDGVPQEETSRPGAVVLPRTLPFFAVKRFVFE
jgi:serine/threonine-protein kinase